MVVCVSQEDKLRFARYLGLAQGHTFYALYHSIMHATSVATKIVTPFL